MTFYMNRNYSIDYLGDRNVLSTDIRNGLYGRRVVRAAGPVSNWDPGY